MAQCRQMDGVGMEYRGLAEYTQVAGLGYRVSGERSREARRSPSGWATVTPRGRSVGTVIQTRPVQGYGGTADAGCWGLPSWEQLQAEAAGMHLAAQQILPPVDGGALVKAARRCRGKVVAQVQEQVAVQVAANGTGGMWGEVTYRELQAQCKGRGVSARGKREELVARLA